MISKVIKLQILFQFLVPFLFLSSNIDAEDHYDIVVYGGSSAGVTASIQAARMGKEAVLICTGGNVGGLTASGLGATDINNRNVIGGIAREFYARIYDYYSNETAWNYTTSESYFQNENRHPLTNTLRVWGGKDDKQEIMWVFEPSVAEDVFKDMLLESGVKVIYDERLDLEKVPVKEGNVIKSITMESGRKISGGMFIDATYEGDLMAKAGVSYTVGRESNSQYNETLNGILPKGEQAGFVGMDIYGKTSSDKAIDPFIIEGDPGSGLLPFTEPQMPGEPGDGDHRVQTYCYRSTMSTDERNFRTVDKPSNYNPLWFEHIARTFKLNPDIHLFKVIGPTPLPNKKWDINGCNLIGVSHTYPEADYTEQERIAQMHKDYALGKIWFLQNDPRVPEHIRSMMKEYGLPIDEFMDNDNFSYELYVREARRMISDYVMTEHHVRGTEIAPDSVAIGSYALDSHAVSKYVDNQNRIVVEGGYYEPYDGIYPISYQSIRPKKEECENLLIPVCISATHAAYGSIRMEPQYMVMGQSAAVAACIALDEELPIQDIQYEQLKNMLELLGQFIDINRILD